MAMPALSIVAREVIEAYHDDTNAHPVGTGPYILTSWTRKAKMVLEANPDYRGFVWDFAAGDPPATIRSSRRCGARRCRRSGASR